MLSFQLLLSFIYTKEKKIAENEYILTFCQAKNEFILQILLIQRVILCIQ